MSEPEIIKTDDVELGTEKIISTTNSKKRPSIIDQIKEKTKDPISSIRILAQCLIGTQVL